MKASKIYAFEMSIVRIIQSILSGLLIANDQPNIIYACTANVAECLVRALPSSVNQCTYDYETNETVKIIVHTGLLCT
jgi:hypothetical protein